MREAVINLSNLNDWPRRHEILDRFGDFDCVVLFRAAEALDDTLTGNPAVTAEDSGWEQAQDAARPSEREIRANALDLAAAMVETKAMRQVKLGRKKFKHDAEKRKHRGEAVAVAISVARELRGAARLLRDR